MNSVKKILSSIVLGATLAGAPVAAQTITPGYDATNRTSDVRVELVDTRGPANTYAFMDLSGKAGSRDIENLYALTRTRFVQDGQGALPAPTIRYETGTGVRDNIHLGISSAIAGNIGKTELFVLPQVYATREGLRIAGYASATRGKLEASAVLDKDKNFTYIEGNLAMRGENISPNVRVRFMDGKPSYAIGVKIPLR